MRLIFVRDENGKHSVSVNGESYRFKKVPESVPSKVLAVQVYTTYTEVENADDSNEVFADPPSYVHDLVQAWQEEKKAEQYKLKQEEQSKPEDEDEA